jgi:hypothetical protein
VSSDNETEIKGNSGQLGGVLIESRGLGNGASFSGNEINHLWLNDQGKDFITMTGISGADHDGDSRSMAVFDYDHDGYRDFVLANANRPTLQLFRNKLGDMIPEAQRSIPVYIQFVGGNKTAAASPDWSPRDGYGAKIWIEAAGQKYLREFRCGEGLGAQNSNVLALGIGKEKFADKLTIIWPSGKQQSVDKVAAGALLTVFENPADSPGGRGYTLGSRSRIELKPKVVEGGASKALVNSPELAKLMSGKTKAPVRMVMSWFATCAACKKFYPSVNAVRAAFAEDELAIFGFNNDTGNSAADMAKAMEKSGVRFINLTERTKADVTAWKKLTNHVLGSLKLQGEVTEASDVTPVTLFLDEQGNVLHQMWEFPTVSQVTTILHKLEASHR